MSTDILAETKTILIEVGNKVLIVGANETDISQFRKSGEDRYYFMSAGELKHAVESPVRNVEFVVVNGRLPPDLQDKAQTIADRAKAETMYMVENGAAIKAMMHNFPFGQKGVLRFEVPSVISVVELNVKSSAPVKDVQFPPPLAPQLASAFTLPPPTKPELVPAPAPTLTANLLPDPPPPQKPTLEELLQNLEEIYKQCGGQTKKVTERIRSYGYGEPDISDGALYQRCLTIRKRLEKQAQAALPQMASTELLGSEKGQLLLQAIESLQLGQQEVIRLASEVAAENARLQELAGQQAKQLENLPGLQHELAELREKTEAVRSVFGLSK